jgi:hypothetical protein
MYMSHVLPGHDSKCMVGLRCADARSLNDWARSTLDRAGLLRSYGSSSSSAQTVTTMSDATGDADNPVFDAENHGTDIEAAPAKDDGDSAEKYETTRNVSAPVVPTSFHTATVFFLASEAPEDAAQALVYLAGSAVMILGQMMATIAVWGGTLSEICRADC